MVMCIQPYLCKCTDEDPSLWVGLKQQYAPTSASKVKPIVYSYNSSLK